MITIAYISKAQQVRSNRPKKIKGHKKPKHHVKTPIPEGEKVCACENCGKTKYLEKHHVFYGPNRDNSSKHKCIEWLCWHHHRANIGIHGGNADLDLKLKQKHQKRLMDEGMSLEEFIRIFGKNYLAVEHKEVV